MFENIRIRATTHDIPKTDHRPAVHMSHRIVHVRMAPKRNPRVVLPTHFTTVVCGCCICWRRFSRSCRRLGFRVLLAAAAAAAAAILIPLAECLVCAPMMEWLTANRNCILSRRSETGSNGRLRRQCIRAFVAVSKQSIRRFHIAPRMVLPPGEYKWNNVAAISWWPRILDNDNGCRNESTNPYILPSESNHILLGHCQRLQKVSSKSVRNFFQSRVLYILHIARGQTENNFVRWTYETSQFFRNSFVCQLISYRTFFLTFFRTFFANLSHAWFVISS